MQGVAGVASRSREQTGSGSPALHANGVQSAVDDYDECTFAPAASDGALTVACNFIILQFPCNTHDHGSDRGCWQKSRERAE